MFIESIKCQSAIGWHGHPGDWQQIQLNFSWQWLIQNKNI